MKHSCKNNTLQMKKALIIAYNDLNNSGVPNVIYQTIKALQEQYIFDVLVFGGNEYYYQKLCNEGIHINLIKYIDNKPRGKLSRLFWWFYKMPHNHYLFMKKLLKENDYSVIHSFKEYYSWPFFKAAKEVGINKRIYHCNVNLLIHRNSENKFLFDRNLRLSIKYSTNLVGVSELCCKNAFKDNKYSVIYNSYDEQKYNLKIKNKLSDDELVITHVASYSDNKNQLFSLKVLKELKKLYKNTKLNLVGATDIDHYYQSLIDYVKDNKLENSASFIKRTSDVEKIYENTTFVIIPSFSEGFSLVAVEAEACGINVFASTNVTNEVDVGGVTFLDLSRGPSYWADYIYKLFIKLRNDRSVYNVEKFSFDKFRKQLIDFYR